MIEMDNSVPTPESLAEELKKHLICDDDHYILQLSVAFWMQFLKYAHFALTGEEDEDSIRMNTLIIGPTGSGKTKSVRLLSKLIQLPIVVCNASMLTGEGFKGGNNVSSLVMRAIEAAGGDECTARYAIIVLDEFDKLVAEQSAETSSYPMSNLLTFVGGSVVSYSDRSNQPAVTLDTSHMLFVFLGSFPGLDKIISKRLSGKSGIGFGAEGYIEPPKENILKYATKQDLNAYGLLSWEMLGRITLISYTNELTFQNMKTILTESLSSPVRKYDEFLFKTIRVHVSITDAAACIVAEKAMNYHTGARALEQIVSEIMEPAVFTIGSDESIDNVIIDSTDNALAVKYTYNGRPDMEHRGQGDIYKLSDIEHDILDSVPFSCMRRRSDILLLASAIHKSYRHINALSENLANAANLIIVTAICSHLIATRDEKTTFIHLYKEIDIMTNDTQARSVTEDSMYYRKQLLEEIRVEFLNKARSYATNDDDFANAKKIAKCMLSDYCKAYLTRLEKGA